MRGHDTNDSEITRCLSMRVKKNTGYILVEFMQTIASIKRVEELMGKVDVGMNSNYVYFIKV
jgi:hypothetical protein